MMSNNKFLSVDINLQKDEYNRPTKFALRRSDGSVINFDPLSLFAHIFVRYLGLPSLQDLKASAEVARAKNAITYKSVGELWGNLHRHAYRYESQQKQPTLNSKITLLDVQLTEFVNKSPGVDRLDRNHWRPTPTPTLVTPSSVWLDLARTRSETVSALNFGDVRFKATSEGMHLVNAVSSGSGQWAAALDAGSGSDVTTWQKRDRYLRRNETEIDPLSLLQGLTNFTQNLYPVNGSRVEAEELSKMTLGGFPVLLSHEVYDMIADHIRKFGAVAIDKLTGILVDTSSTFPLDFFPDVPKWCLLIGSRRFIKGVRQPEPIVCSAWTATIDSSFSENQREGYLQWMFKVGVEDWQSQLEFAVEVINTVQSKVGGTVLFEFDEEKNRFDSYTPFNPHTIRNLFSMIKKDLNQEMVQVSFPNNTTAVFREATIKELYMGGTYNISGGQQGAVGDSAEAHDFNMVASQTAPQQIDLAALAQELSEIRAIGDKKASEPEEHMAMGAIAAAEVSAKKGDKAAAIKYLKSAGAFALEVAKEVSAKIAAEILTSHIIG